MSTPSHERTHVVTCPVCATRMTVRSADSGRETECPDCGHIFKIKEREVKLNIPEPMDVEDEYGLKEVTEDPDAARKKMGQSILSQAEKELQEQAKRKDLHKNTQGAFEERPKRDNYEYGDGEKKPRENLTPIDYNPRAELVDFPIRFTPHEIKRDVMLLVDVGLLMRWVFLSIFAAITLYCTTIAIYYASIPSQDFMSYMTSFASTAVAVVFGAGTVTFLGSFFLFLVMSISSGIDEWDWPELGIFDRLVEALFFMVALAIAMAPFGIVVSISPALAIPLLIIPFFAFPVLYLSLLDQGSILVPWSSTILASLFQIPGKWFLFYAATFVMAAAISVIGYMMFYFAGMERLAYIAIPSGVITVGGILLYGLWLGRLSWEISDLNSEIVEKKTEKSPA